MRAPMKAPINAEKATASILFGVTQFVALVNTQSDATVNTAVTTANMTQNEMIQMSRSGKNALSFFIRKFYHGGQGGGRERVADSAAF